MRYLIRPCPQSAIEEECLWSLVQGYAEWCHQQRRKIQVMSYWRELGLLPLLLLCALTAPVWASTVYVAKTGNDAHTCTQAKNQATPRLTVQQGIACLASGDHLILGDGIYHEQIADVAGEEQPGAIRPPSGLSWSQPTTIKAANPRKAVIDKPQPGHPYNHTVYLGRADTRYLALEGLVIDGRGHGTCVWVGPSTHIRLKGNLIKNCGSHGVLVSVADDGSGAQDMYLEGERDHEHRHRAGRPAWLPRHLLYRQYLVHPGQLYSRALSLLRHPRDE